MCAKLALWSCLFLGSLGFSSVVAAGVENCHQPVVSEQRLQRLVDLILQILPSRLQKQIAAILQTNVHLDEDALRECVLNCLALEPYWYEDLPQGSIITGFLVAPVKELEFFQLSPLHALRKLLCDLGAVCKADVERHIEALQQKVTSLLAALDNKVIASALQGFVYEVRFGKKDTTSEPARLFFAQKVEQNSASFIMFCREKAMIKRAFKQALPPEIFKKMVNEKWYENQQLLNAGFAKLLGLRQKYYKQTMIYELTNSITKFFVRFGDEEKIQQVLLTLLAEMKIIYACAYKLRLEHERNCLQRLKSRLETELKDVNEIYPNLEKIFCELSKNLEADLLDAAA